MHRRAARTLVTVLLAALATLLAVTAGAVASEPVSDSTSAPVSEPSPDAPPTTEPEAPTTTLPERSVPPITDNEFLPESANLSDCVGFVERPGCGSEARGGVQQTLIFVALATGLAIIFWRVSVGVRRNRRNA